MIIDTESMRELQQHLRQLDSKFEYIAGSIYLLLHSESATDLQSEITRLSVLIDDAWTKLLEVRELTDVIESCNITSVDTH